MSLDDNERNSAILKSLQQLVNKLDYTSDTRRFDFGTNNTRRQTIYIYPSENGIGLPRLMSMTPRVNNSWPRLRKFTKWSEIVPKNSEKKSFMWAYTVYHRIEKIRKHMYTEWLGGLNDDTLFTELDIEKIDKIVNSWFNGRNYVKGTHEHLIMLAMVGENFDRNVTAAVNIQTGMFKNELEILNDQDIMKKKWLSFTDPNYSEES